MTEAELRERMTWDDLQDIRSDLLQAIGMKEWCSRAGIDAEHTPRWFTDAARFLDIVNAEIKQRKHKRSLLSYIFAGRKNSENIGGV